MSNTEKEYTLFEEEWVKEVMKMSKKGIVEDLLTLALQNQRLISYDPEILKMLVKSRRLISSMKLSMSVHPDCEAGGEFDDLSSRAQVVEDEIELLINKATDI